MVPCDAEQLMPSAHLQVAPYRYRCTVLLLVTDFTAACLCSWIAAEGPCPYVLQLQQAQGVFMHRLCCCRTAVHLAARSGNVAMLRLLLEPLSPRERLELVNQPDNNSITPTFLAVQRCVLSVAGTTRGTAVRGTAPIL